MCRAVCSSVVTLYFISGHIESCDTTLLQSFSSFLEGEDTSPATLQLRASRLADTYLSRGVSFSLK